MTRTAWQKLADDLIALDTDGHLAAASHHPRVEKWREWIDADAHPVDLIINGDVPSEPFADRLILAIDETTALGDLEWIARALTQKKLSAAVQPLIAAMKRDGIEERLPTVWAIGNAIYTIAPKDHLDDLLEVARMSRLGDGRNRVIEHLSRHKKSDRVFETLVTLLNDESVRGAALAALKRFGDPRAIRAIEQTPVRAGDDFVYERHQKDVALKTLREKAAR